ncbi:hypothetical protein GO988_23620 [Hymenobacter sp. HMF4947]|uniref:Uncharacterized protein n=1 Tax=Hymenobacter ginkgonis TaxID=2682976 RepID=A0A7K1TMI3_9BACT|nr:immunity 26/phosphotriesterase HocA family protein [Hymenobacter ginkgonis]MVN79331.1 hypothetical protein [Hymenobacter ginkgonis]
MEEFMGSPQITIGAVLEIDLEDGYFAYARILGGANYGIYDLYTPERILDIAQIIHRPIMFIVAVYNQAVNAKRWVKIGKSPLPVSLQELPFKFIQDGLDPESFRLYNPISGAMTPALKEECRDLERCAVWSPEQVEERIRDHHAGRLNRYLKDDRELFD